MDFGTMDQSLRIYELVKVDLKLKITLSRYTITWYINIVIQSFANTAISDFFYDEKLPRKAVWANVKNIARRKLTMLNAAQSVSDLKSPPGNKLEALKGDLKGFYSVRVNDQWRVIFRWNANNSGPTEVNVVDYHK